MKNIFENVYLEMIINENNQNIISQSLAKNLGITALAGLSLLSPLSINAATNNSSKLSAVQIQKLSQDEDFVARTLYSQSSTLCTSQQVIAIAKVIQNRIGKKEFGNCSNAVQVCKYPGAFSSVTTHNSNWDKFSPNLNKWTRLDTLLAKILTNGNSSLPGESWMKQIVYYHDKSISKPSSWDNKYYTATLVKETTHFKFYKAEAKPKTIAPKKK